MTIDLPQFIEDTARAFAAEAGVDVATYIAALICADEERRLREDADRRARAAALFVPDSIRQAALDGFLARRAERLASSEK